MVLGPGEMNWNIVSCNASVFIELLHAHFFTHNDWVETSLNFTKKKGWLVVLPLQWFSVLVEWIEILFIAMHPSSSYYCMPIFSPTMIGWKLHFILSFWWIVSFLHSFIFPLCQTLLLQPMVVTISIFTSVLIVAYFSYGHYFSLLCIGHSFIIFLLYRSLLITWVETSTSV